MQRVLTCAIYTRVSTDNQADIEFNSCEAQEAKTRSFIQSQENMEVYRVYSDPGFTGANLNRPALNELLNDIQQNKINLVISYKIDRLTRSPKDFYTLIEFFERFKVDFISVTERFDTSTPSGRLLRNIMLTFAQFERELASERTRDKMLERANKGMWNGGMVPFGYSNENKRLIINKVEARILKNIFETYVSTKSLFAVYRDLKTKGIKDENGLPLSKSRLFYILRNIIYTGKVKYAGRIYQGNHPPIISEQLFNSVQEVHKKDVYTKLYKDYSLAGLLICKECDSFMTPCHTNKKRHGRTNRYYYYRCTKTFKRDWNACQTRQISATRLDDYIFQNLERISLDKHYLDSLIFTLNNLGLGDHAGLELISETPKFDPKTLEQSLKSFVEEISKSKGVEKNIWAKKFIKRINYSKDEIKISLYYKECSEKASETQIPSGRVGATAGINKEFSETKKGNLTVGGQISQFEKSKLAPRAGLEPATCWLTASRSYQLSYRGV